MQKLRSILTPASRQRFWEMACSLRVRLPLRVMLVTLPAVVALMISLDRLATHRFKTTTDRELRDSTMNLAHSIERWDGAIALPVQALAADPNIISMSASRQRPILELAAAVNPQILWVKTSRLDGSTLARSDDQPHIPFGDRAWFRRAASGEDLARQAVVSRTTGESLVVYAAPIRDASGEVIGVVSAAADLADMAALVNNAASATSRRQSVTAYRAVVDEQGRAIAHPDRAHVAALLPINDNDALRQAVRLKQQIAAPFTDANGVPWLSYHQPLPNGWTVFSARRQDEVLAEMAALRKQAVLVSLVSGMAVALLAGLGVNRLLRSITRLTRIATAVAEGQLDQRADEHGRDEVGLLSRSFNRMVERLQQGMKSIEQRVERRTQALHMRNAELNRARQAAEQSAQLKDEFLANMSHEIRTPLTAILGYAELLVDMQLPEAERAKALQSIHDNGQHLLDVINDVLDIAKLEAAKMEVERMQVPPTVLINDVLTLLRAKAEEKGLMLDVEYASPLPELIETDPMRLKQILMNLLGNSIKYTENGSIILTVRLIEGMQANETFMQFDVTDTGIGMTDDHLKRLFKPFSQGCQSTSRRFGGTGLGLVISQKLARLLGGDIAVTSTFGEGSTFSLTIQVGATRGARMMSPHALMHDSVAAIPITDDDAAFALCHARILLADDNPASRLPVAAALRAAGADVTEAINGKIACHLTMEAFQNLHAFDVVLMDMRMPEMDGLSAVKQLRKLGYPGPIVAFTASVKREERDACIQAGFNDFAQKPLPKDKLIALVAKWRHAPLRARKTSAA